MNITTRYVYKRGWTSVHAAAVNGVPYSGLWYDRYVGGVWHDALGHDTGDDDLEDLVIIDDQFEEELWTTDTLESIHSDLEAIADRCLAAPDPWSEDEPE